MKDIPTKPYFIRAIYEWCSDSGFTPYLSVKVDGQTRVPREHVKDGEIVLNIGHDATRHLTLGSDVIQFSARFNGVSREMSVPMSAVIGIFAKETMQGMFFPPETQTSATQAETDEVKKEGADQAITQGVSPPAGAAIPGGKRRFQVVK